MDRGTRRGRSTAVAPAPAGIVSGMTSGADPGRAETAELSIDECLRLLGAHRFGRLAVAVGEGVPAIRPLQYAFDARAKSIVMRIGEGSTLHAVTHSAKAAFEIDGVDEPAKTGWSVIVVGVAIVVSSQALALEPFSPEPLTPDRTEAYKETPACLAADEIPDSAAPAAAAPVTAKIIEFPRSWTPPPAPLDELAEAVSLRPRILEAPEVVPSPPALGGITIEPVPQPEFEKRPGIDIPLEGAPLARRILSALIDDFILATACALFGCIFWKLTAIRPPRFQMVELVVGFAGLFWAAYQYLLMVYAGTTPGLRLARLQLTRFDGSPAGRRLRRWRVLASYLSAISLGMGYGWVLLDEDSLCWHDRITHTYLSPAASQEKQPERPKPDSPENRPYQSHPPQFS